MASSHPEVDPAFHGAGEKEGLYIWRIENFSPVPVPKPSYGKFFTGDSYIILKSTALENGSLSHDIHYWLGKDTTQDEAGTAAIKTVELDDMLGGKPVQHREVQGYESEIFLSYFKPCIVPQPGGFASGFKHTEVNKMEHTTRLYLCKGRRTVHVKEVPFDRSSLNHGDIFILDTADKIFQFNGATSSIQERGKALEVVQHIKELSHGGSCQSVIVQDDGEVIADTTEASEFWSLLGGFAPIPANAAEEDDDPKDKSFEPKLLCIESGKSVAVSSGDWKRDLLDSNKSYLLDCGLEIYMWLGHHTSLEERKAAASVAEKELQKRPKAHVIRVVEGYETEMFKSKFDHWP